MTPELHLTKGVGGALLRERVVPYEADRFVVLVTPEKLGARTAIPIEVVPFAMPSVTRHFQKLGGQAKPRNKADGYPFFTDNQNWILDTDFGPTDDPEALDAAIRKSPGVVDTGIFLGMAHVVMVGDTGAVRGRKRGAAG